MYKTDLALSNLQWLICHKTKPNQTSQNMLIAQIVFVKPFRWHPVSAQS